jgi:DNA/RNA-binding protein KIN17
MQDKGDEEREQRLIREQIKRAQKEAGMRAADDDIERTETRELKREEGEKVKLSFGAKPTPLPENKPSSPPKVAQIQAKDEEATAKSQTLEQPKASAAPVTMKIGAAKPQAKNVFATKKNALGGSSKKPSPFQEAKKMSEAERIMIEEMEKSRKRPGSGFGGFALGKKQRTE